jgi:hypothetical protein
MLKKRAKMRQYGGINQSREHKNKILRTESLLFTVEVSPEF